MARAGAKAKPRGRRGQFAAEQTVPVKPGPAKKTRAAAARESLSLQPEAPVEMEDASKAAVEAATARKAHAREPVVDDNDENVAIADEVPDSPGESVDAEEAAREAAELEACAKRQAREAKRYAAQWSSEESARLEALKEVFLNDICAKTKLYGEFVRSKVDADVETMRAQKDMGGEGEQDEQQQPQQQPGSRKRKAAGQPAEARRSAKAACVSRTQRYLPLMTGGEMRQYQLDGVRWLAGLYTNGINGILADQMGLGKTVQTIGLLSYLKKEGIHGPFIIVAPLSTLRNWQREVARWAPSMQCMLYHGTKPERVDLRQQLFAGYKPSKPVAEDFPIIVTSYETILRDISYLRSIHFKYLVVDEGHRLKNANCLLVKALQQLSCDNKLLLTGTPLQNNLTELWALLHFILPQLFTNAELFEYVFNFSQLVGTDVGDAARQKILEQEKKERMVSTLHNVLRPFMLRRIKSEVEKELPLKQEIVLYVPMAPAQVAIREELVRDNKAVIQEALSKQKASGGASFIKQLQNITMQLRKLCNHPDHITGASDPSPTFPPADELVQQCGKFQMLDRLLVKLKRGGHKVLIFSQFVMTLTLLDSYLDERGYSSRRIDGQVSGAERQQAMDDFNSDPDCFICLLSTRAGGQGINLVSADTVIIYDSDWNPHQDMQAMDRAHRIGQTKPVLVLRLCTTQSVEVKLLARAASKLALERLVIKKGAFEGATSTPSSALTPEELLEALTGATHSRDAATQARAVDDETLDRLLDRTQLAAREPVLYEAAGPGYEVIAQQTSGLLAAMQPEEMGADASEPVAA